MQSSIGVFPIQNAIVYYVEIKATNGAGGTSSVLSKAIVLDTEEL